MDKRAFLRHYIETEFQALLRSTELYVLRSGMAQGDAVLQTALEVLNEVVVDALKQADRFDMARQPRPWLMGMVVIAIKRRHTSQFKRRQREPLIRDLYEAEQLSEDEIFERVVQLTTESASANFESEETITLLLSALSDEDQYIVRLAVLNGLNGDLLAKALGISAGAARVRLHRALKRLRHVHSNEGKVLD